MYRATKAALLLGSTLGFLTATCAVAQQNSAAAPGSASSQLAAEGLEEITVTARRRAENLQDVPIAITVLSSEEIRQDAIVSIIDLAAVTPFPKYPAGRCKS
jgi:iron complex outermembrane recepter protein